VIHRTTAPYFADSKIRPRGSQLFYVDPNVTNEGLVPAVAGSIVNYQYKLPFLAHNFPVRRIRVFNPNALEVTPALAYGANTFLTLRRADGHYLCHEVPIIEFLDSYVGFPINRPLLLAADFFPDPRMSYVTWNIAGSTARLAMEFHYA